MILECKARHPGLLRLLRQGERVLGARHDIGRAVYVEIVCAAQQRFGSHRSCPFRVGSVLRPTANVPAVRSHFVGHIRGQSGKPVLAVILASVPPDRSLRVSLICTAAPFSPTPFASLTLPCMVRGRRPAGASSDRNVGNERFTAPGIVVRKTIIIHIVMPRTLELHPANTPLQARNGVSPRRRHRLVGFRNVRNGRPYRTS